MTFKYIQTSGDFKIDTPKEMPKHELIKQTSELTHNKFTYSNGWVLESIVQPHRIEYLSSVELIKKSDGTYYPKF